jgi:hypothetical protein
MEELDFCFQFRIDDILEKLNLEKQYGFLYASLALMEADEDYEAHLAISGISDGGWREGEAEIVQCVTGEELEEKAYTEDEIEYYRMD